MDLAELMARAHDASDDDLYEWVEAEWERRQEGIYGDVDVEDGWTEDDESVAEWLAAEAVWQNDVQAHTPDAAEDAPTGDSTPAVVEPVPATKDRSTPLPDLSRVSDDELLEVLESAHDARDDDLYEWADAEWERRQSEQDEDVPGWQLDDDESVDTVPDGEATLPDSESGEEWERFRAQRDDGHGEIGYRPATRGTDEDWADLDEGHLSVPTRVDGKHHLGAMLTAQGWDGPIEELDDDEFDAVADLSPYPRMYRGVKSAGATIATEMRRAFIDEDSPWIGAGVSGDGWYFSDALETAAGYAAQPESRSAASGVLIEAVLRPAAQILDAAELLRARVPRMFWAEHATRYGYDAIAVPSPRLGEFYYVVLNRSAIVVRRTSR